MIAASRRAVLAGGGLLLPLLAYLLLWPVPVEPVAWTPPADPGHTGLYGGDERLRHATALPLGNAHGPEDAVLVRGRLYASVADGNIVRVAPDGSETLVFAEVGGRPLGIEADGEGRLIVANALLGLQRVSTDGRIEVLVERYEGEPLRYVNDVAVATDGRIFFSQSTTRFPPDDYSGTLAASLLDILEHGSTGRVFVHDPAAGTTDILADGFSFANGVALSADERYLLLAETAAYRIWRIDIADGTREVIVDGLPDFPDNLNRGLHGRIWVGLVAPRDGLIDRLANRPWLRRVIARIPESLRPAPVPHAHVIAIDADGTLLMNLADPAARATMLTGAVESRNAIYLTSLTDAALWRLDKAALTRP